MQWADAVPNLLIGLREGLEAGLVVSALLAAVRKADATARTTPVWLGVTGAVSLAGSFAAVLTYSSDALSSRAQQAVGGVLSILAVALVTGMVFWMRRTARGLSAQLRGEVVRAMSLGAGALTLTAFFAVSREGLETTLFAWTAVKASASTAAPLLGAATGLALAVLACWLMFRKALKVNLGLFFQRTAVALIVIAAGVLAYGLRDLQEAGWLPGQQWVAFDLTSHVDPTSWWMSIVTGVTQLTPRMTVLQVVAYLAYLAAVLTTFLGTGTPAPAEAKPAHDSRWSRLASRRAWPVAVTLVTVPAVLAGLLVAVLPTPSSAVTPVSVAAGGCGVGWSGGPAGSRSFAVTNRSARAAEVTLVNSSGAIVAEIETLGPATTATMSANLAAGDYRFSCLLGGVTIAGTSASVAGTATGGGTLAVRRVSVEELTGPNTAYQAYAAGVLRTLAAEVATLRSALAAGDLAAARRDWLAAQLDWERVGASYDSFGDAGRAVDGLPLGPGDPHFTGLHRIERGLWHGESAASLLPVADELGRAVATVRANLTSDDEAGDPTALTLRVHEVLEDALRDHLSGNDDQGAGAGYALTYADAQVTGTLVDDVAPLLATRMPSLVPTLRARLAALETALLPVEHATPPVSLAQRQAVDAALGSALESLALVPTLLEVPPTS